MTNTYSTGNALGSTDPRDLLDNASNLDDGMNSALPTFTDRLGVSRDTWAGMQNTFNLAQSGREAAFQQFLADSGFVSLGNYAAGLNFTAYNQYMARDGFFYRPAPSSIPFTTTGTWVGGDENLFNLFSADDVLRQDLANTSDPLLGAGQIGRVGQVVDSIAALKLLDKTAVSKHAFVTGYYAAGDGGGGAYYFDATDVVSADNGGTVIVAADGGRWKLAHTGSVSIDQFGAVGDGVADDTSAIQSALSSGVRRVTGGAGRIYRHTATLNINSNNFELDLNRSRLLLDDVTGLLDHLRIGDNLTQKTGIKISRVTFTRAQVATGGAAIRARYVGVVLIEGCRIFGDNKIFDGISVARGIIIDIKDNYIDNVINLGIYLFGTGLADNRTVDVTIRENRIDGGVTALSTWDFVEGVFCRDNIFFNTSGAIVVVNASNNANGLLSFKFQENDFDTTPDTALFIDKVNNVQVTGCWFSSIGGTAIDMRQDAGAMVIAGNQIYPIGTGIRADGTDVQVNGNIISGGIRCVELRPSSSRVSVVGNTLQNSQYAIDLSTAPNTNFSSNLLSGISDQQIQNNGGTGTQVRGNQGDTAVGTGSFQTVGASPWTYTAGNRPETLSVFGGTVSNISVGATQIASSSGVAVTLPPGRSVTITYSSVPFVSRIFQ